LIVSQEWARNGLKGTIRVPSDKSLTHRAFLLAAIADSKCNIKHPLLGDDPRSTLSCLKSLGCEVSIEGNKHVTIHPPKNFVQTDRPLDCGNSGTTARLICGLLASRDLKTTLIGDSSLSKRPMKRVQTPLELMGAKFENETLPMTIYGSQLRGICYESPVSSAQIKSCVLLAGLRAQGNTMVIEPSLSRDHTETMLASLGVNVTRGFERDGRPFSEIEPKESIPGFEFSPPADISSAAFFMVASAIVNKSDILLTEIGVNPTRVGILEIFDQIGIKYSYENERINLGEPRVDISIQFGVPDKPFTIEGALVARLIDEIPILGILATQLNGTSVIRDAKELRVKESDRIEQIAVGLSKMGAQVETFDDGLAISGPTPLKGAQIDADGDHRIAMSFAIAGLIAGGETVINGAETITTSYPDFIRDLSVLTGMPTTE